MKMHGFQNCVQLEKIQMLVKIGPLALFYLRLVATRDFYPVLKPLWYSLQSS